MSKIILKTNRINDVFKTFKEMIPGELGEIVSRDSPCEGNFVLCVDGGHGGQIIDLLESNIFDYKANLKVRILAKSEVLEMRNE